jgi:hypothetical protein
MLVSLAILAGAVGCNSGVTTPPMKESTRNLKVIDIAYKKAMKENGKPPQSLAEIMPFLKEEGEPADFLRSPEDGQEYVIHWGMDPNVNPFQVLAYEKEGKNGKRYVLWGKAVFFMRDEEFKEAPFPPGYKCPI